MATIAILGAYGETGTVVTEELRRRCDADLRIGGRDIARATDLAQRLGGSISAGHVDALDDDSLRRFVAGSDLVVNCAGPSAVLTDRVVRVATDSGCAYVDPGGDVNAFGAGNDIWDELAAHSSPAIIHAGWIPGLTGVLTTFAVELARERAATIDSIELVYGDRSVWSRTGLTDIMATVWGPNAMGTYVRGAWRVPGARAGVRRVRLPAPFGSQVAVTSYLAELRTLGETERGATVGCYLAPMLSARQAAAYLRASALFPFAPEAAARALERAYAGESGEDQPGGILAVKVLGSADDGRHEVRAWVTESRNYWITGVVCAIAAQTIFEGRVRPGLQHLAEAVDPRAFVAELRDSGVEIREAYGLGPGAGAAVRPVASASRPGTGGNGRPSRSDPAATEPGHPRAAPQIETSRFSGWIDPPADLAPPLCGRETCEVAVVGGGYTGLAAALRLAEAGRDVALLEADFCGFGASSRNAGHLTPTIAGDPNVLLTLHRRRASELLDIADAAVTFTEGLIERFQIDCDYEQTGNVYASLTPGQLHRAERLSERLAALGGHVDFVDESGSSAIGLPPGFLGGIHERRGGHLNPGKLCRALRRAVRDAGVRVHEGTRVRDLGLSMGRPLVRSASGELRADQVLLATNAHARDLAIPTPTAVAPLWVTMAESEPIGEDDLERLGWTSRAGIYTQHVILESYRPTARGTIVFGTRVVEPSRSSPGVRLPDRKVVDELVRALHDRFPALSGVRAARAWGGWIAMTSSWLPIAGRACRDVYYALGYNGHGLAQAPYLGTLLAERLLGEEHEHLSVLWRDGRRFAPVVLATRPAVKAGWLMDRLTDRTIERV